LSLALYLIVFQIFKRLKQIREININFYHPLQNLDSLKRRANIQTIYCITNSFFENREKAKRHLMEEEKNNSFTL